MTTSASHPYVFLAWLGLVAFAFPASALLLARIYFRYFQRPLPNASKASTYECGVASAGDSWIEFKAHYYLYALFFLIFDVEAVFLLPFAVVYGRLPVGGILCMAAFLALLAEGLVWLWGRGHLQWT
ncbi:MAG TPA: NADH-quinone oxidoreductase subunit A [Opitutaceae bacterium]|nr:NADH-quinone oxidoreductase subunit A [Opitutaceae bacterium]